MPQRTMDRPPRQQRVHESRKTVKLRETSISSSNRELIINQKVEKPKTKQLLAGPSSGPSPSATMVQRHHMREGSGTIDLEHPESNENKPTLKEANDAETPDVEVE